MKKNLKVKSRFVPDVYSGLFEETGGDQFSLQGRLVAIVAGNGHGLIGALAPALSEAGASAVFLEGLGGASNAER